MTRLDDLKKKKEDRIHIGISVLESDARDIHHIARKAGISVSELIRRTLKPYLDELREQREATK